MSNENIGDITPLTTKEKIERYLSLRGAIAFSDHEECGEEDHEVINDVICRASGEISGFLYPTYSIANLAKSKMACEWATALAAFYLTKRRGNNPPESLYEEYERIMGKPDGLVWEVRKGSFLLPCVPKQNHGTPTYSNLTVDRRFYREKVRVVKSTSSNVRSEIEQDRAPENGRFGRYSG